MGFYVIMNYPAIAILTKKFNISTTRPTDTKTTSASYDTGYMGYGCQMSLPELDGIYAGSLKLYYKNSESQNSSNNCIT